MTDANNKSETIEMPNEKTTTLTDNEINAIANEEIAKPKAEKPKRRRRLGDRKDGYRIRTINSMNKIMPFIMPQRCDACNTFAETLDITEAEKFVSEQLMAGRENFSMLHVILAAYVRTVSQHPALNRFVSGQRIYARNDIQITMTVKKTMSLDSPDTCIKVWFDPEDTVFDVYDKFNKVVEAAKEEEDGNSGFEDVMNTLSKFPRPVLRFAVWALNLLDYHGLLPTSLLNVSPFHGSMVITSMGSLGIKPIYHHIYNFGNLPVFVSYGTKRRDVTVDRKGNVITRKVIDMKVVTDERICDGFQYAAAFKCWKKFIENPTFLISPPETVKPDID